MQEKTPQNVALEKKFRIGSKYSELSKKDKSAFLEYITHCCGGSLGTWQQRLSHWMRHKDFQCGNNLVLHSAYIIATKEEWRKGLPDDAID